MRLLVIAGPTATGKTALAAAVAHALGTEVLSADSRQIYRGLDLGTGKDLEEFRKFSPPVPYHLIDIADPEDVYTLYRYQEDCYRVMESLSRRANRPLRTAVMAGGTGLYMESVLRGYRIANVPENPGLRQALMERNHEDLAEELLRRAPELACRTDLSSKKRVARALEIHAAETAGEVGYSRPPDWEFSYTVCATICPRTELRARIDRRLERRLADGMVAEVEGLLGRGLSRERLLLLGMEYREIAYFLNGEKTYARMFEDLRREIHFLAKRQETYFRGMERRGVPVHWLSPGADAEEVLGIWKWETGESP